MRDSRQVLVKVVLFQLRGRGHPQDNATPSFFPDSKSSILGLLNSVFFVSETYWKCGYNSLKILLKSWCTKIYGHQCRYFYPKTRLSLVYASITSFNVWQDSGSFKHMSSLSVGGVWSSSQQYTVLVFGSHILFLNILRLLYHNGLPWASSPNSNTVSFDHLHTLKGSHLQASMSSSEDLTPFFPNAVKWI